MRYRSVSLPQLAILFTDDEYCIWHSPMIFNVLGRWLPSAPPGPSRCRGATVPVARDGACNAWRSGHRQPSLVRGTTHGGAR